MAPERSRVASSREDAWIETNPANKDEAMELVASSREDAWIETSLRNGTRVSVHVASSREDAWIETPWNKWEKARSASRPPARTRGLKPLDLIRYFQLLVASSREDAWIETSSRYSSLVF